MGYTERFCTAILEVFLLHQSVINANRTVSVGRMICKISPWPGPIDRFAFFPRVRVSRHEVVEMKKKVFKLNKVNINFINKIQTKEPK